MNFFLNQIRRSPIFILFLLFLIYLLPIILGYSWNALQPMTPMYPGVAYQGRMPNSPVAIEVYGTGAVAVPFRAKLTEYLKAGHLPLWNPYQGLGQPFAAMGEGDPFSPLSIIRTLLPYSLENVVTFLIYYLSGIFLLLFLKGLGASTPAALFGTVAYVFSGALTLHIPRINLADQLALIPVLFWIGMTAMKKKTIGTYLGLGLVSALFILAGFLQIALASLLVFFPFCLFYSYLQTKTFKESYIVFMFCILGFSLAAFHFLPVVEVMQTFSDRHPEGLALIPMPFANVIAFFFPYYFGQYFENWLPGGYPDTVAWHNLYGCSSAFILFVNLIGIFSLKNMEVKKRKIFLFFFLAGTICLLKYISFPGISFLNMLPIISRQSPKHINGINVFCFSVSAALFLDSLVKISLRSGLIAFGFIVSTLFGATVYLINKQGGISKISFTEAMPYWLLTIVVLMLAIMSFRFINKNREKISSERLLMFFVFALLGELFLYFPLGNSTLYFLCAKIFLGIALAILGLAISLRQKILTISVSILILIGYGTLITLPSIGLSKRIDLTQPPPYMIWLKKEASYFYRSFGIWPDYSGIGSIQDLSAIGPLSPMGYVNLIKIISRPQLVNFYLDSKVFSLVTDQYNSLNDLDENQIFWISEYLRTKPIFDWLGIKYLVLDKEFFSRSWRKRQASFLDGQSDLLTVYRDQWATIFASSRAQPKAVFSSEFQLKDDEQEIIKEFQSNPVAVFKIPNVTGYPKNLTFSKSQNDPVQVQHSLNSVWIEDYQPNDVRLRVKAASSGIVILKDLYSPGWKVFVNKSLSPILKVNGLVRGVYLPSAGEFEVQFKYLPQTYIWGSLISAFAAVLFSFWWALSKWKQMKINSGVIAIGTLFCGGYLWVIYYIYYIHN